jgi:hypothetical protein
MKITEAKPIKIGNSYGFIIPRAFITNGLIDLNRSYSIDIEEVSR